MHRSVRERRGQALLETAILFPLLLMLVLGAVDFGRAFADAITASSAARQAAAYAAQHQQDGASAGGSCQRLWGETIDVALASGSPLQLSCSDVNVITEPDDPYGRTPVTVTIQAPYQAFTPFIAQPLGLTHVGASATARGEVS